jgi:aspartyl-tRNA(Asn)/glutamyl-tRNA(Gln) amidotransferase subunit A
MTAPHLTAPLLGHVYRMLEAAAAPAGPLRGLTFAVKDNFAIKGIPTTAGMVRPLRDEPAEESADAVVALEQAGAQAVALVAMDELAHGFTNLNSRRSACRNAHDTRRIAGGSSGGSAVAVARGEVDFALASDTNGSARVPAAFCGVYGLKPTHGWTSSRGLVPLAHSLDHVGVIARSLDICKEVVAVLAGGLVPDDKNSELRWAAIPSEQAAPYCSADMLTAFEKTASLIPELTRITLPPLEDGLQYALTITSAEFAQNHAALLNRIGDDALNDTVRAGLEEAVRLNADAIADAERGRTAVRAVMAEFWRAVDIVMLPTTPCTAPRVEEREFIGSNGSAWEREPYLGIFTSVFSLVEAPAISLPLPRGAGELPLGIQLVAAPGQESRLLTAAARVDDLLHGRASGSDAGTETAA